MKEENEVILDCEDLTSSSVSKNFFGIIRKRLLKNLTRLIHEELSRAKQKREEERPEQIIDGLREVPSYSLNYFIAGERGSGKTTFLKHLVENLRKEFPKSIGFLHWYDPSESFGVPNDLFITVTAAVKTRMRKLAHEPDRQKEYNSYRYRFCEEKLDKLDKAIVRFSCERKALSNMSEYRASALSSEEPEMNGNIRENFRESMKLLCELEQVDAFVLVIDDIDIQTEQCCNVLENLRLYLSNDYLIVLMAGDRENNLEHVREKFFKEYDIEYHRADKQGKEVRMNSTVSHAAQYFAKLFPVKQQFDLEDLNALLDKNKPREVILRYKKNDGGDVIEEPLKAWLLRIFNVAISEDDQEATSHVNIFLSLPFRNIIQIVEYWIKEGMWDKLDQFELEGSNVGQHGAEHSEVEHLKRSLKQKIEELVRIALNRSLHDQLPDLSYNYGALNAGDRQTYYDLLLKLCQETSDFEYGNYLIDKDERSQNNTLLALVLAANFKRHVNDFKGFLSYLFYGPATITLYRKALEQFKAAEMGKNSGLTSLEDFRKSFEEYLSIGKRRSALRWAQHANMIWCYDYKNHFVHSGVIRIQDSKTIKTIKRLFFDRKDQNKEYYARALSLIVSMNKSDDRGNSYYISFHSFLAFMLECIEVCDEAFVIGQDRSKLENEIKMDARNFLYKLIEQYFPITICKCPEWQIPVHQEGVEQKEIILLTLQGNDYLSGLIDEIIEWYGRISNERRNKEQEDDISPQKMGRLWSISYNLLRTSCHSCSYAFVDKKVTLVTKKEKSFLRLCLQLISLWIELMQDAVRDSNNEGGNARGYFMSCIGSFPLIKYLGAAYARFNDDMKGR